MAKEQRISKNKERKTKNVRKRAAERKARRITREMEKNRPIEANYINLVLLRRLMDERCGGVNPTARAARINPATLHRRMNGISDFTFREMLRVSYVLYLTDEEFIEVFYKGFINYMTVE